MITEREGDLEDTALVARQVDLDWERIFQEIKTQEDRTGQFFLFAVFDTLDVLCERHNIVSPITDRLVPSCLENALLVSLDAPKTIEDIREKLDYPNHQIYNKRRKFQKKAQITVNRSGRLNTYQRVESTDH